MATTDQPKPSKVPRGLAARAIWLGLLALVALAAVPLQIDRASRNQPGLERYVPGPFQGFASYALITQAINSGGQTGLDRATHLLRWYPVPAEHLTMYAAAANQANRTDLAVEAMSLSARRGWRDPTAQRMMYEAAVQAGEWKIAADRLGALWVGGQKMDQIGELLPRLLDAPEGRRSLLSKLESMPMLRENFATWASANVESAELAGLLAQAQKQGMPFDCDEISRAATNFIRRSKPDDAESVWAAKCAKSGLGAGTDLAFGLEDQAVIGPFDWRYLDKAGLTRSLRLQDGQVVMDYRFKDPFTAAVAEKYTHFAPGPHVFAVFSDEAQTSRGHPPILRVDCVRARGKVLQLNGFKHRDGTYRITIPADGCLAQRVRLVVSRGAANGVRVVVKAP